MMVVPVDTRRKFIAGKPDFLFEGSYEAHPLTTSYGVSPDGQRFLMVKSSVPLVDSNRIDAVLNWVSELEPHR